MRKFKIFLDFEKEEQYLNDMVKKGYHLKKYSAFGFYYFTYGEKQDLKYHIDYRTFKNKKDFEDYKAMFEDFGWEHVYGTRTSANQYFLPKNNGVDDNIFSSKESAAARYKKLYEMCIMSMCWAALYFFIVLICNEFKLSNLGFLTPGLWEKTGDELIRAVLFELPFVVLRIVPILLLVGMGMVYGVWANKVHKLYKQKIQGE